MSDYKKAAKHLRKWMSEDTESMKVYMHKETGALDLMQMAYFKETNVFVDMWHECGLAFENKNGVVFLLPLSVLEFFEEIGDL